ncbi:LacI family DNA-binding transcriptional regulator [Glutamicibacter sp. NPDC087344]|uniref:LacI family DNA-binding transcriptional regulator n=1 Tax=Glutamicibacter sp. NPDC087344 TaxID=3363994 RepID=UPI0037F8E676
MTEPLRRRPTIRDVASHAGVSKSLVSLVLSDPDRVSAQRREKVERSIRELGYQPNLAARSLSADNPRAIGVVLGELHNPWALEVAEVVRDELQDAGFDVLFSAAPPHAGQGVGPSAFKSLRDLRVSGFLVLGTVEEGSGFESALEGAQAVFIGSGRLAQGAIGAVEVDDAQGISEVVKHLVDGGLTRIVHVTGGPGLVSHGREAAYHRAMRLHGLQSETRVLEAGPSIEAGRAAVAEFLEQEPAPQALVCFNDLTAFGALQALDEVSQEAAVTGYDNIALCSLKRISLTSVDPDSKELGKRGAQLLLRMLRAPDGQFSRQIMVSPELIVRTSSRPN